MGKEEKKPLFRMVSAEEIAESKGLRLDAGHYLKKETCDHKPDGHTFSYSGSELIIDVNCRECGVSGSFIVEPHDINWE